MKASLDKSFRDCLGPRKEVSDWECLMGGCCLKTSGTAIEVHFQPEALNEVLKGFALKLTPMSFFCAQEDVVYLAENSCKNHPA